MLRELTDKFGASLIVNDYTDIALTVNADGVHLGQDDLPLKEARKIFGEEKIIGISMHSDEEAIAAKAGGADYVGFGPVFHTETRDAGKPKGIAALREIKKLIKIPLIAIGEIKAENLESVIDSGADAAAVSAGIETQCPQKILDKPIRYVILILIIIINWERNEQRRGKKHLYGLSKEKGIKEYMAEAEYP